MTKKLLMIAACAAAVTMGSGIAQADPDQKPAPDPNGPKCWTTNDAGHQELTPCGWAYSDASGWYEVPWGWRVIG